LFAKAPVEEEVFGEEHSDDHTEAIVHPTGGIEAPHGGINEWVARFASFPCFEVGRIARPLNIVVLRLECLSLLEVGEIGEKHVIELTPDQFGFPLGCVGMGLSLAETFADADCAEAEVNTEAASAVYCGVVAVL